MNENITIKSNTLKPKSGQILISEPLLTDPYFSRSVILLIEHNETDGSVGIILNKKLDLNFNKLVKDAPKFDSPIFFGGPVETSNIYFLHTLGKKIPNSIKVTETLYWGGDIETVNTLIESKVIKKENIRFFLGYSGWSPNQLEEELKTNSWAVVTNFNKNILNTSPIMMWKIMVEYLGEDYKIWNKMPTDPQQN